MTMLIDFLAHLTALQDACLEILSAVALELRLRMDTKVLFARWAQTCLEEQGNVQYYSFNLWHNGMLSARKREVLPKKCLSKHRWVDVDIVKCLCCIIQRRDRV